MPENPVAQVDLINLLNCPSGKSRKRTSQVARTAPIPIGSADLNRNYPADSAASRRGDALAADIGADKVID